MNGTESAAMPPNGASSPPSVDELDEAIGRLASRMSAMQYRLLVLVREFDERFGWAKWSFESCAEWLAWRLGIGRSAAREKVRVAHALRDLPEISRAFEQGCISYSKVRALTRAADATTERVLLDYARRASAVQVEERCREIRNVQPESAEEASRAWRRRSLSIFRNRANGTVTISVELPHEAGEIVARALDKAVQNGDVANGPEFGREGWHAQQADALVAVARAYLSGLTAESEVEIEADSADAANASDAQTESEAERTAERRRPVSPADHYQVVVHVEEAALRGGRGRSEAPIETVRRLACDAGITVVTEDERGEPLNVGRRHRIVSGRLRRALWSRDRGCVFPGCRKVRYVDAHHLRHWVDGGETSLENMILLCTDHHRLVHEGQLRVARREDGSFEFRRADGRAIPACGYGAEDASAEAWLASLAVIDPRRAPRARDPA